MGRHVTPEQKGAAVLVMAAGGVGIATFNVSRDAFVLLVWVLGAAAVWYAAKTPNKINNPSPEGAAESGSEGESQVNGTRVTKVGDSCTILSHPSERRSYGVDQRDTPKSGGA
jgi:hypothetical protein